MPRAAAAQQPASSEAEPVRVCADCRRSKSVRGVWYLVPGRAPLPFVCETCFASQPAGRVHA